MDEEVKIKPVSTATPFLWLSGNGSAFSRCWLWALIQCCWPTQSLPAFLSSVGYLISFSWESWSHVPNTKHWFVRIILLDGNRKLISMSPQNDGPKILEVKEKAPQASLMFSVAWQKGLRWLPFLRVSLWGELAEKNQPSLSYKAWVSPIMFPSTSDFSFHHLGLEE